MQISSAVLKKLKRLLGSAAVRTDEASLALNSYDCSPSSHRPDLVLIPKSIAQIPALLQILHQAKIPFIVRASATNHAGSCAAVQGGAVIQSAYLRQIEKIDISGGVACVQAGVINADLQQALQAHHFFYAPDPASEKVCTLGGNLAQNASGARCLKYGNTADNTLQADFLLPDGRSFCLRHDAAGPDWLGLIAGSEGTLGFITRMQVKILPQPEHIKTFLVSFASLTDSIETVSDLVSQGLIPRCVEAMDKRTIEAVEQFSHAGYPLAEALLILELDGSEKQIKHDTALLEKIGRKHHCQHFTAARTEEERKQYWKGRQAAYAALTALGPNLAVADGTVPRSQLPKTLEKVKQIIAQYGVTASLLFHAGDGNFHPQLVFDARSPEQTRQVNLALKAILKTCVDHGGTISGEHGIGIAKRALMSYQYSRQTLRLFQKIKQAFDPFQLANPAKIIPVNFEEEAEDYSEHNAAVLALQQQIKQRFMRQQRTRIVSAQPTHPTHLSTQPLNRILDIDTTNYTATVQAGVTVPALLKALAKQHVFAPLPADYTGTLGALVATKANVAFTKQIIGIQAILPDGDLVYYGGKIMKNAAGYNLCRLFTGSWGAFGLITQITLRIYATPCSDKEIRWQPPQAEDVLFQAVKQQIDPNALFYTAADKEGA